jgi:hypothetical protein
VKIARMRAVGCSNAVVPPVRGIGHFAAILPHCSPDRDADSAGIAGSPVHRHDDRAPHFRSSPVRPSAAAPLFLQRGTDNEASEQPPRQPRAKLRRTTWSSTPLRLPPKHSALHLNRPTNPIGSLVQDQVSRDGGFDKLRSLHGRLLVVNARARLFPEHLPHHGSRKSFDSACERVSPAARNLHGKHRFSCQRAVE